MASDSQPAVGGHRSTGPDRGRVVVIAGPDGSGKSTISRALPNRLPPDRQILRIHHRPRVLPSRATTEGSEQPHSSVPYPRWAVPLKMVYLFVDYLLGWTFRVRPHVKRGGWVLVERGWWDLQIDPARYRLTDTRLIGRLARLLPRPDHTVILLADPDVIAARKGELPRAEIRRQSEAWVALAAGNANMHVVDVARSLDEVVSEITGIVIPQARQADRDLSWVGLPSPSSPRWFLPRTPAAATRASLAIYQPVTAKGQVGWAAARAVAALGLARVLPAVTPPEEVLSLLQHAPRSTGLAIAKANHAGRYTVLLLKGSRPVGVAKVALTHEGREALEAEHRALTEAARQMSGPVVVPRILDHTPGILLLETVTWSVRRRPWLLPPEVAQALGVLYRATGTSHGDTAPWNLLQDGGRFTLIDWEEAGSGYPPFFDPLHFLVQAHSLLGKPSQPDLLDGLAGRGGWIDHVLSVYAAAVGSRSHDRRTALADYLAVSAGRIRSDTTQGRRALRARRALSAALRDGSLA